MRFAWIAVLAALVACNQQQAGAPVGCAANAKAEWNGLDVEAVSAGESCSEANATLSIKTSDGAVLHSETYPVSQLLSLVEARDAATMEIALAAWIDSSNSSMATSAALPEWPAGADGPQNGEFPFHPEEGMTREAYLAVRAADAPLFCYVQGMESLVCLALENGALTMVGVQQVPE